MTNLKSLLYINLMHRVDALCILHQNLASISRRQIAWNFILRTWNTCAINSCRINASINYKGTYCISRAIFLIFDYTHLVVSFYIYVNSFAVICVACENNWMDLSCAMKQMNSHEGVQFNLCHLLLLKLIKRLVYTMLKWCFGRWCGCVKINLTLIVIESSAFDVDIKKVQNLDTRSSSK